MIGQKIKSCAISFQGKKIKMYPIIVVHGGAGDISNSRIEGKLNGVIEASKIGSSLLLEGKSAMDAVIAAVKFMEDNPYFNAGK